MGIAERVEITWRLVENYLPKLREPSLKDETSSRKQKRLIRQGKLGLSESILGLKTDLKKAYESGEISEREFRKLHPFVGTQGYSKFLYFCHATVLTR